MLDLTKYLIINIKLFLKLILHVKVSPNRFSSVKEILSGLEKLCSQCHFDRYFPFKIELDLCGTIRLPFGTLSKLTYT